MSSGQRAVGRWQRAAGNGQSDRQLPTANRQLFTTGWLITAACWTLFGLITGGQVWLSMITHGHSVPLLVGYYVAIWEAWLLISVAIAAITRRWPLIPLRGRNLLVHAFAAIVLAVAHITYWIALTLLMKPYDRMTPTWEGIPVVELLFFRLPLELLLYLVVAGIAQAVRLEKSLMNARLHALELQLQPHFLFNTLNTISGLVRAEQNSDAVTMIAGLSDLLRYTLDHAGQQEVSLEQESEMLRRYLEIQRMRFPDRLTFSIDVASDVRRAAVPTFILQPLAENAIRHGIARSAGAGVVTMRAARERDRVRIEIFNSGTLPEAINGGIGLRNTRERLQQLYGDEHDFELRGGNGGVVASMTIPMRVGQAPSPVAPSPVAPSPASPEST